MTVATVVGGGLAGALVARALTMKGMEVTVLDAGDEPGGVTVPIRHHGYLLEPAAGTLLLPHPDLSGLLAGLDLQIRPAGGPVRRFVRHLGSTVEVSPGPRLLLAPLLSGQGKLRLLAEPFVSRGTVADESIESFLVRRLGGEAGRLTAWLMASGVHAGEPGDLSVQAAFPVLPQMEERHRSLARAALAGRRRRPRPASHVVAGGTSGVARAVADSLGQRWHSGWKVEHLERTGDGWVARGPGSVRSDVVVAAVPPEDLAPMGAGAGPGPWDWAPVAVVWLGTRTPPLPAGLGVLVGPQEHPGLLGLLHESSYAPGRAPAGRSLVKAILGGARHPELVDASDRDLVGRVVSALTDVAGAEPEVEMEYVLRHRPGIPQYTAERQRRVADMRASLAPGLLVAGWGYDGVGISSLASAAVRVADRLSAP